MERGLQADNMTNTTGRRKTFLHECFEASLDEIFEELKSKDGYYPGLLLPIFQRPYQWGPAQVRKLMKDVELAIRNGDEEYFMGNIVLVPDGTNGNYYIVDGQQRITTMVIIISVCRYLDAANSDTYTNWLTRKVRKELQDIISPYRLSPERQGDNNDYSLTFEDRILDSAGLKLLFDDEDPKSRFVKRLRKNAVCIRDLLEILQVTTLTYADYIWNKCKLCCLVATDLGHAFRMFCSINIPSGLPLSTMDYYRARLYGTFGADSTDGVKTTAAKKALRTWTEIETRVGGADNMQQFLVHFCCIQHHSRNMEQEDRRGNITNAFSRQQGMSDLTLQTLMEEYLRHTPKNEIMEHLNTFSNLYWKILSTEQYCTFPSKEQNHSMQLLRYITAHKERRYWNLWITIALKAISVEGDVASRSKAFWNQLEKLFALFISAKSDVSRIVKKCDEILFQLHESVRRNRNHDWGEFRLSNRELKMFRRCISGDIYSKSAFGARYLLLSIEVRENQTGILAGLEKNAIKTTVEHICPQKPEEGTNWSRQPWSVEYRQKWLHKFGNLALLERSHNTEVQNSSWEVKRRNYEKNRKGERTPFYWTSELCRQKVWNPDSCEKRQREIEEILHKKYNLNNGPCQTDIPADNTDDDDNEEDVDGFDVEDSDEDEDDDDAVYALVPIEEPTEEQDDEDELCPRRIKKAPHKESCGNKCKVSNQSLNRCGICHTWDSGTGKRCEKKTDSNKVSCSKHNPKGHSNKSDKSKKKTKLGGNGYTDKKTESENSTGPNKRKSPEVDPPAKKQKLDVDNSAKTEQKGYVWLWRENTERWHVAEVIKINDIEVEYRLLCSGRQPILQDSDTREFKLRHLWFVQLISIDGEKTVQIDSIFKHKEVATLLVSSGEREQDVSFSQICLTDEQLKCYFKE